MPDARAYNILIKGYARAGVLSLLPELVADMQLEVGAEVPRWTWRWTSLDASCSRHLSV